MCLAGKVPLSSRSFFVSGAIVVTMLVAATTGLAGWVVQQDDGDVDLAQDQGLGRLTARHAAPLPLRGPVRR